MSGESTHTSKPSIAWSDLRTRVLSGIVLAGVAVSIGVIGGWPLTVLAAIMTAVVAGEWISITRGPRVQEIAAAALAGAAAVVLAGTGEPVWALGLVVLAAITIALWLRTSWNSAGIIYGAGLGIAIVVIRADPLEGLRALGFVAAVVWGTDIAAYFAGRRFGGPKLWPAVSPKKTWSGAIGGAVAAMLAGVVLVWASGATVSLTLAVIALLLSIVAQLGDLFESAIKRRFGVKDASHLIPGHGGLMDRVDGLTFAAIAAALIGWAHAGGSDIGRGLLQW